ncbi:hypothetical protein COW95_00920, partial [Candidatus Peregrinibacteria bacterium CG22_combo_CG10-13_8_21_14_all_49_11]
VSDRCSAGHGGRTGEGDREVCTVKLRIDPCTMKSSSKKNQQKHAAKQPQTSHKRRIKYNLLNILSMNE